MTTTMMITSTSPCPKSTLSISILSSNWPAWIRLAFALYTIFFWLFFARTSVEARPNVPLSLATQAFFVKPLRDNFGLS
jgi:hypothetical protein